MHRYTTADVAEAAGRVRPVVVRVLREPPSADGSWDITPSPIKTGTPQTMASSKPKADHASLTLRPHMIQLGLALQLASGTASELKAKRIEHAALKMSKQVHNVRLEMLPEPKSDFARTLRQPSTASGTSIELHASASMPVLGTASIRNTTSRSAFDVGPMSASTVRLGRSTNPAATLRYTGLDASAGQFSPKQFVSPAGSLGGPAALAYTMTDTLSAEAERRKAKAVKATAAWSAELRSGDAHVEVPSLIASPIKRPQTAINTTVTSGIAPATVEPQSRAPLPRPTSAPATRVKSVQSIIEEHQRRREAIHNRKSEQQQRALQLSGRHI